MKNKKIPITVAEGDGIGPEIMSAVLEILKAAQTPIEITKVEIGEKIYLKGHSAGIEPSTWDTIRKGAAFLKAPITTPQGGGFKSLNVTIRTTLGLYANIRPCVSYYPYVDTKHPDMNVIIVRENEEDLYTGIEYRQTPEVYQALKIISHPACEKIIRYAFEYARAHGRKKVTCFTKDNILKISDGHFHRVFEEVAKSYPDIVNEHWIVDIGAAKLADTPTAFDVIVLPNLYGDILSDVAAQIAGSVGLAGSANIGTHGAMFEAIHGSAPRRAGQNMANPSGLLLAAIQMLVHIGLPEQGSLIHNAWLKTLEEGIHTYDIFKKNKSTQKVGTKEFAQAVIERLGQNPLILPIVQYPHTKITLNQSLCAPVKVDKRLIGIDVFIDWRGSVEDLKEILDRIKTSELTLKMIANRGVRVWPEKHPETFCVDCWRCRYTYSESGNENDSKARSETHKDITHGQIIKLLQEMDKEKVDFVQTQLLYLFDGKPGYSLSQDEQ
jgi:isocitrate dehydrogenase